MECERPDDSLPGATIDRQAEVRLLQLNFRVGGASVAAVWAALKALLGSCCISRREQVHVSFSGKVGYGHEETIIQALGAALKGHHLTLEQAGSSNARASAPEAAILFYRVAARLDVEDILRQMKTLTEEHPQVPVAVVLAHNVSVEQMQRKHGSKMASSNS